MEVGDIILHEDYGTLFEIVTVNPRPAGQPLVTFREYGVVDGPVSTPQDSALFHRTELCVKENWRQPPAGYNGPWPSHVVGLRKKRIILTS